MRISTGFAIVLVGATAAASVASAQNKHDAEKTARVHYGDDDKPAKATPHSEEGWIELATPTPVSHGTEFIVVGKDLGAFAKLRVDAHGSVIVRRVKVYFDDGTSKVIAVNRTVGAPGRTGSAILSLHEEQPIDRIVVTTEPQTRGSYAIYGAPVGDVAARDER